MTSGFGVDGAPDGSSGTSSQDIRRILAAQNTPGVVYGCDIVTSATEMAYTVTSGVVAIGVSADEVILAPVDQAKVVVESPPATGTRIDRIYVKQRVPGIPEEGDANIEVGVVSGVTGGVLPANSLELRRFQVSAGAGSNTDATIPRTLKIYSIPTNGSLGLLHYWQNTYSGPLSIPLVREGYGTFALPTDRRLQFKVRAVLSAEGASGFDNSKYCEWGFLFGINQGDFVLHGTPGLHQSWATYEFSTSIELPAGTHTVNLGSLRLSGPGRALCHSGTDPAGFGRRGIEFSVYDEGPVQSSFDLSPSF